MDTSPSIACNFAHLLANSKLITVLVKTGITSSKSDARRKLEQNQIALNNKKNKVKVNHRLSINDLTKGITIVWLGKTNWRIIVWKWTTKDHHKLFQCQSLSKLKQAKKWIENQRPKTIPVINPLESNPLFIKWKSFFPNTTVPNADMFETTFNHVGFDLPENFFTKKEILKMAEIHPTMLNLID